MSLIDYFLKFFHVLKKLFYNFSSFLYVLDCYISLISCKNYNSLRIRDEDFGCRTFMITTPFSGSVEKYESFLCFKTSNYPKKNLMQQHL